MVTDFMMPVMDGAVLIEALAADPDLKAGYLPEAAVAERCSGYALFVRKPFKIIDMIDVITDLLD